ncbi:hypothetical protein FHY33_000458 [Xanthomonas arboricola]|nr:hypothetical protein [Xanthomonas campestris]
MCLRRSSRAALLLDDTGNYHHVATVTFNAMQVLPVPWNTTAGVDVNNLFDRDSPAVLSAVTNSLDSASAFPVANAARTTPSVSNGRPHDATGTQRASRKATAFMPRPTSSAHPAMQHAIAGIHRHLHGTPQR